MLKIKNLKVKYSSQLDYTINDMNLQINEGEILGIVGQSGCGKTTLIKSILGILPDKTITEGTIKFKNKKNKVAYIPQNFYESLSDRFTVGQQFHLLLKSFGFKDKIIREKKMKEILLKMEFEKIEENCDKYPFEMSGGERQRILIGMSVLRNPDVIIADEPTSAIDADTKKEILDLFKRINQDDNITIVIISHDLPLISNISDKIAVLFMGNILEYGTCDSIMKHPQHPYTNLLIESAPDKNKSVLKEMQEINESGKCLYQSFCPNFKPACGSINGGSWQNGHYVLCVNNYDKN